MNQDEASTLFVGSLMLAARSRVETSLAYIDGTQEARNPLVKNWRNIYKELGDKLRAAGLLDDAEFREVFAQILLGESEQAIGAAFTLLDGGWRPDNVAFEARVRDGDALHNSLHEIMHEFSRPIEW